MKTKMTIELKAAAILALIFIMPVSCMKKSEKIEICWDNSLVLPPVGELSENIGLAGVFAGFGGGGLMIAGGANFPDGYPWEGGAKKWWRTLYLLDTLTGGWSVYDDFLDKPTAYGASVQLPEGVLCIGGGDSQGWYDNVALLSFDNGTPVWSEEGWPRLPYPLANVSATMLDGVLYVAGGKAPEITGASGYEFMSLDTADLGAGWHSLPPCPGESGLYSVYTAQAGRIFALVKRLYGEGNHLKVAADGYSFDPEEGRWTKLDGDFPAPAGTAIPYGEERIIFLGGADKLLPTDPHHPGFSAEARIYNVLTGSFEQSLESPYTITVTTAAAVSGDTFYVASGESRPGVRSPNILKGIITERK